MSSTSSASSSTLCRNAESMPENSRCRFCDCLPDGRFSGTAARYGTNLSQIYSKRSCSCALISLTIAIGPSMPSSRYRVLMRCIPDSRRAMFSASVALRGALTSYPCLRSLSTRSRTSFIVMLSISAMRFVPLSDPSKHPSRPPQP